MSVKNPKEMMEIIFEALKITSQRAVIMKSWDDEVEFPDTVFVASDVPHDWLFPRMAAVIHHGGLFFYSNFII